MEMGQRALSPVAGEVVLDSLKIGDRTRFVWCCGQRVLVHPARGVGDRLPVYTAIACVHWLIWRGRRFQSGSSRACVASSFFCGAVDCGQRIISEGLPHIVTRYAKRTCRLRETLNRIALALGGVAGSHLAQQLGMLSDGSTLLRQLRLRTAVVPSCLPRVLDIDDWAWRKDILMGNGPLISGSGEAIDLQPDREAGTVARWLCTHPGTETLNRDCASTYTEAARKDVPQAVKVADWWCLLHNLSDALKSAPEPYHRILAQAASAIGEPEEPDPSAAPPALALTRSVLIQQQKRQRRHSFCEQVMELARRGMTKLRIAGQLNIDCRTVRH
jgi:hypothetical protein